MGKLSQLNHNLWTTGGILVPEQIREQYLRTYLEEASAF